MKDFNYCVWFLPNNNEWYNITNEFLPHMTIKHSLSFRDALNLYSSINTNPIEIELDNEEIYEEDKFWAFYYLLKPINNKPLWWPKGAHISFLYQYDKPIKSTQYIKNNLVSYKAKLTKIALVECNGHFTNWKILKIKS
tara:strand:+ start:1268 stop:1684 length:417 start_codon:yes stop_codon:yes gene_type:complete